MSIPSILLAFLIASFLGAFYHLWRGGGPKRILFNLLLAWAGFLGGHFLAQWQNWYIYPLGALNLGFALLGAAIFLLVGDWLGKIE
ncbi:MAG: hypothetical protein HN736_06950 [Anaerolineae bacterium]|jgi:uncharacterized membrane protein YeaQ/YmgE (transglycosylase-associated protein family)|nr:hypothetical protein [Anaerolineae bacterium]MBT3713130.1 hypothetical protein [Anaerolineae bacterium]MBT4311346.1 hypothetical protein [Anaerolineae bacterium]MBT4459596.1 hypothetical protein [Anaerolineae bacterium]MBT4841647.1 hypothetical protein [Anaerolineae bacterium]